MAGRAEAVAASLPEARAASRPRPRGRDRLIVALARVLARRFFRSVEVVGDVPRAGPAVLAASHLNGFVDPVLLVAELGALPRFLAKGTLWDVVPARPFLAFARILPVHRRQDRDGAVDNRATFAASVDALGHGHLIAVFPEGTTHDDPTLRPLRTGVARIAIQAAAEGVDGVRVVPVGVTYEDKVAVRGRALVHFGTPIPVVADARSLDPDGAPAHEPVQALTDELRSALTDLTPHFASTQDALALNGASRTSLRTDTTPGRAVPLADVTDRARALGGRDPATVDGVVSAFARYQMLLSFVGLSDEAVVARGRLRAALWRSAGLAVLVVLLAPLALAGVFANLVPVTAVLVAGLVPSAPVSKGTIRVLVALVAFPLTWLVIAVWDVGVGAFAAVNRLLTFPLDPVVEGAFGRRTGVLPSLLVFVAIPVFGLVALVVLDRLRALVGGLHEWWTLRDRRGQLVEVREARDEVVRCVAAALDGADGARA